MLSVRASRVVNRRYDRRLLGGPNVASEAWEPDALTAHVRIYEGATSIVHGSNYADSSDHP